MYLNTVNSIRCLIELSHSKCLITTVSHEKCLTQKYLIQNDFLKMSHLKVLIKMSLYVWFVNIGKLKK